MMASPSSYKANIADVVWVAPRADLEIINVHIQEVLSSPYIISVAFRSATQLKVGDFVQSNARLALKVTLNQATEKIRTFSGIITEMEIGPTSYGNITTNSKHNFVYEVIITTPFWLLTNTLNTRHFQKKNIKEIFSEVVGNLVKPVWKIKGTLKKRDYCVQYQESGFNFLSRLFEDEGIYYYFDHENEKMVLSNDSSAHKPVPHEDKIHYTEGQITKNLFFAKQVEYRVNTISSAYSVRDYFHETSRVKLDSKEESSRKTSFPHLEAFEGLETYQHGLNFKTPKEGDDYAKLLKEQIGVSASILTCRSNNPFLAAGSVVKLQNHFDDEIGGKSKKWMIQSTEITVSQGSVSCFISAIPNTVIFKPQKKSPKPLVWGVHTAMVTGPPGAEIYLDELGRCKVQLHWDREGEMDEKSSIWVRVSNNYAGKNYGIQWIPRVGHEVLVQFINGDPDLPIIVGRLYNNFNTPPLGPGNKFQNIIKTISDNHILFDDQKGKELVEFRAEKDLKTFVVHDKSTQVGNDLTEVIDHNASQTVKVNKDLLVKEGNFSQDIKKDKTTHVGKDFGVQIDGSQMIKIKKDMTETVGKSKVVKVKNDIKIESQTKKINLKAPSDITIESNKSIKLKVGMSSITIKPTSIDLKLGANKIQITPAVISIQGILVKIN